MNPTHAVYKETLNGELTTLEIPGGVDARILHAEVQHDHVRLWFLCDPTLPVAPRRFHVVPTGLVAVDPHAEEYIGTVTFDEKRLVFHVFEVTR